VWLAGLLAFGELAFGEYFSLLGERGAWACDDRSFGGALLGVFRSLVSGEERFSCSLATFSEDVLPSFFSIGGISGLAGVVSLPILLHVCASNANGLFFASNVVGKGCKYSWCKY